MLELDDPKWRELVGGYRIPVDLPGLIRKLESSGGSAAAWADIWQELYHQGDVGEGSYAAVPHLVRIHRERGVVDWNTYALVASIEIARGRGRNPPLPGWCQEDYEASVNELATMGLRELPVADNQEAVRSILGILAIAHGAGLYARFLIGFTEDEAEAVIAEALGE